MKSEEEEASVIMPSSSFFSGLDQVSEQPPRKSNRSNNGFVSSLQDSPYLSSPIRPIPSFSRQRSSNLSVSSKRSRKYHGGTSVMSYDDRRASSPAQSTVGSLQLNSPYSESIFSLHSLCTKSMRSNTGSERHSSSRSVLLPQEIDDLRKQFNIPKGNYHHLNQFNGKDDDNDQYDMSDFDDDSTIASDSAKTITDEDVFEKMQMEGFGELLYHHKDILPKEVVTVQEKHNTEACKRDFSEVGTDQSIKLPSVNPEESIRSNNYQKLVSKSPVKPTKTVRKDEAISSDNALKKSPYAVNQNRSKWSTRKKKKMHTNVVNGILK